MTFNKNVQYALMLCFYLSRSGRANLKTVAKNLDLSLYFLEQIARKLRIGKVIESVRGPGGGYSLIKDSTIEDIFDAIDPIQLIKKSEIPSFIIGEVEKRVLLNYTKSFKSILNLTLKRKIKDVCNETLANESQMLSKLDTRTKGH